MSLMNQITENVIEGNQNRVISLVQEALKREIEPEEILNEGMISAMEVVGQRFNDGIIYVPEMLVSAQAMKSGMRVLEPHLLQDNVEKKGTIVLGTVKGDLHDIGKNLVGIMLEGAGYNVIDLGTDTPPEKFVHAIRENNPQLVAMSALLTTTMTAMKGVIEKLDEENLRTKVGIIIGGAPVSREYAEKIGADAYGKNAFEAVSVVKTLLEAL